MQFFRRLRWRWRCRRFRKVIGNPEEVKRLFPSSESPLMKFTRGVVKAGSPVFMGIDPAVEGSDCSAVVRVNPCKEPPELDIVRWNEAVASKTMTIEEIEVIYPREHGKLALMKELRERDKHG